MKKGQTESYSFLIGIIVAFLILSAIGCAVYNLYKPQGAQYFNKMASTFKDLEKKGVDVEEGEIAVYVEKDEVIVGFNKGVEKLRKPTFELTWKKSCYKIVFNRGGLFTFFELESGIERPLDKCPLHKSCLCRCKLSVTLMDHPHVNPDACEGPSVRCETFENLVLVGGKGCPYGVLIPGTKYRDPSKKRELGLVYYKKQGNFISIDDEEPKTEKKLKELLEQEKQEATK